VKQGASQKHMSDKPKLRQCKLVCRDERRPRIRRNPLGRELLRLRPLNRNSRRINSCGKTRVMAASKLIALVFGLLLVFYLAGIFGPGHLVPVLAPVFDPFVTFMVMAVLSVIAAPWLLRLFRKNSTIREERIPAFNA
jgi:hypothetical protein